MAMDTSKTPRIVVIADHAPYLGGPATWQPLREAAPEYELVAIDPLDYVDSKISVEGYITLLRNVISGVLPGASAVIAHRATAGLAIEAIDQVNPNIPLLLLEPFLVRKDTLRIRVIRWLMTGPIGRVILTAIAKKKHRRLLSDKAFVREQLQLLVRDEAITDALLDEARNRIALPQTASTVDRIADSLGVMLRLVDHQAIERVKPGITLVGPHWPEGKIRTNPSIRIVEQGKMAPMLDAPSIVGDALRSLVSTVKPGPKSVSAV
jgi:hypothetical protein